MYSSIKTFDKLCELGCEFIQDKIKSHPFLIIDESKSNLYELDNEYKWIKEYLLEYNKLGYFTVMSQPGIDKSTQIYQNCLDYKQSFSNPNILPLNGIYGILQRAEIQGFMENHKALKLYELLKNTRYIHIY
mgnify:CR=1 FL=1